jgi:chorismate synthase
MLKYLTAGESHGKCLTAILDGMPSGLRLSAKFVDIDLKRRQGGYGRGARQLIESDKVEFLSGVRHGYTLGSPIALKVQNRDWDNWKDTMNSAGRGGKDEVTRPRPGHADLSGSLKYDTTDVRDILERSSARETAVRVAVGAVCKRFLDAFGVSVYSWVTEIGGVMYNPRDISPEELFSLAEASTTRCPDKSATRRMKKKIDAVKLKGDSLGGLFQLVVTGLPPGLGSHTQWDRKLDAGLAAALMSIQAIKGVELGMGFQVASTPGSKVHDEIFYSKKKGYFRKTNNAGGIEGGMSNGEPIIISAAMKPIPTLYKPLKSVDILSKKSFKASIERSDICAVPAASVIGEAVVAFEIARAFLEKFGGDSMKEIKRNFKGYLRQISRA